MHQSAEFNVRQRPRRLGTANPAGTIGGHHGPPRSRLPVPDEKQRWLIQWAAAHDVYHAGQIKLLRRLVEERSRA